MLHWNRLLRIAICTSILCFISTSLLNLKYVRTCTNPSTNEHDEAIGKTPPGFYKHGTSNETANIDNAVFGSNMTPRRNNSEYVKFRLIRSPTDHLVFRYHHILSSMKWKLNSTNMDIFRKELSKGTSLTGQEDFILTQRNTRDGDRIPYFFTATNTKTPIVYYNVTKEFLARDVPKVSPLSGRMFPRCSVVGNSGILSNSKCGHDIDQADYVIRSNVPQIRPHTVDAGRKSNLTTMNPSIATRRFNKLKNKTDTVAFAKIVQEYYGILWLPCLTATSSTDVCLKVKHTLELENVRNLTAAVADPRHFLAIYNFWKQRNLKRALSTGFYMTHLALTMCEEIHLYGFWPFPSYRVSDRVTDTLRKVKYHYFDNVGFSSFHSMNDEFAVLLQMHVMGILNLHTTECGV
ncbi:alpha-N-acetylneuraminide alpha-2,8-sialyltransferase-like [Asterias amurensis]|uniref:alpha-N-acetylneuraminide alpha-2,8-sialyltransferase-like n=1 Tax=Asterias amurensis TaxID=7602 RepID=UPI003AB91718